MFKDQRLALGQQFDLGDEKWKRDEILVAKISKFLEVLVISFIFIILLFFLFEVMFSHC